MRRGYKETEIGEIPEEWEVKLLSDISEINGGTTPSTKDKSFWESGNVLWATPTDVTGLGVSEKYITDTEKKITQKALDECSLSLYPIGSILMTSRATIGFTAITRQPITTNQGLCIFSDFKNVYNEYLFFVLQSLRQVFIQKASGSTFLEISKKTIMKIYCGVPPLPEQKKIAEVLSSVDESIRATQAVIEQAKVLKQGMLNRLLTKGIGHKKFKKTEIGEIPEEWEVKTISEVGIVSTGKTPSTSEKENWKDDVPFVTPSDFNEYVYISKVERSISSPASKSLGLLRKNAILYTCIGSTIGKCGILENDSCCNQQINAIQVFENIAVPCFVYYCLLYRTPVIRQMSSSTAVPILKKSLFSQIWIPIPRKEEQLKIVSILLSIDEVIQENINKNTILNSTKSGLMQDLLSGKKRVKV